MSARDEFEGALPDLTLLDQDSTGRYVEEHVEFAWQMWQRNSELEQALAMISEEMGLPPTIGPAKGELKRLLDAGSAAIKRLCELEAALSKKLPDRLSSYQAEPLCEYYCTGGYPDCHADSMECECIVGAQMAWALLRERLTNDC